MQGAEPTEDDRAAEAAAAKADAERDKALTEALEAVVKPECAKRALSSSKAMDRIKSRGKR